MVLPGGASEAAFSIVNINMVGKFGAGVEKKSAMAPSSMKMRKCAGLIRLGPLLARLSHFFSPLRRHGSVFNPGFGFPADLSAARGKDKRVVRPPVEMKQFRCDYFFTFV
jgi:hypothetical protein